MASFKGGIKEAAKMLQGMGPGAARNLLAEIRAKDPKLAESLEKNMVAMEDLQYLSPAMLVGLLRDVDLEIFGLALRTVEQSVVEKLLAMVSTGIRLDIEDGLKGKPRKVSEVDEAQAKILEIVRQKIAQGSIVINPAGDELV